MHGSGFRRTACWLPPQARLLFRIALTLGPLPLVLPDAPRDHPDQHTRGVPAWEAKTIAG